MRDFDKLTRRMFCSGGLSVSAGLTLIPGPLMGTRAHAQGREPHFLLVVVFPEGLDASYLFDARPLSMTAAGLMANYLDAEPEPWVGANGQSALATRLVDPLKPWRERFSVLNGVLMATVFDGHEQNLNYLFTGNPFGGASFVPHLNQGVVATPLDYVQIGRLYTEVTNAGAALTLNGQAIVDMVNILKGSAPLNAEHRIYDIAQRRMQANGQGSGRFSATSWALAEAWSKAPRLSAMLRNLDLTWGEASVAHDLGIVGQFFKSGITASAVMSLRPEEGTLDTHGAAQAQESPTVIGGLVTQLAQVFATMAATPYDDHRSLLDVTTIVATSEFSRTMRQQGRPIDQTGTDHNPLTNTVIIGGKGIKGGMVLGESDSQTPDEVLSGAHRAFDHEHVKIMGRPFDFATGRARDDRPEVFQAHDYLTFASVANTIYTLFDAPTEHQWLVERNGKVAPPLAALMT